MTNNRVIYLNGSIATLKKVGTTQVKVYYTKNPSIYGIINVRAYAKVTSLTVSNPTVYTSVNNIGRIYAYVNSDAVNKSLGFTSSNTAIATVDNYGVVKGIRKGTTTVKVYSKENPNIYEMVTIVVK